MSTSTNSDHHDGLSDKEYASILTSIINSPKHLVIFALDRNYCYLGFNTNHSATMKHIWGVDIQVGMNMLDLIANPTDRSRAQHNFDQALAGERVVKVEAYGEEPNRFFYEDTYSPLTDANGNIIGVSVFLVDITERVRMEYMLREHQEHMGDIMQQRTADLEASNLRLQREIAERERVGQELREIQEQMIEAHRATLRELSTPLIPLADGVIALPLVGQIDDMRAQQIMETLLEGIVYHQAEVAVLDISGVTLMDTQVADALLRSARAAQMLGTRVVLTGISAEIAQTVVHIGTDLSSLITRSTLQEGLRYAIEEHPHTGAVRL